MWEPLFKRETGEHTTEVGHGQTRAALTVQTLGPARVGGRPASPAQLPLLWALPATIPHAGPPQSQNTSVWLNKKPLTF